jgi:hypothetical protein
MEYDIVVSDYFIKELANDDIDEATKQRVELLYGS